MLSSSKKITANVKENFIIQTFDDPKVKGIVIINADDDTATQTVKDNVMIQPDGNINVIIQQDDIVLTVKIITQHDDINK
jgi:hypothetical protein